MVLRSRLVTIRCTQEESKLLNQLGGGPYALSGAISRGFRVLVATFHAAMNGNFTPPTLYAVPINPVESKCDDRISENGEDYSFGCNDGLTPARVEQPEETPPKKAKAVKPAKSRKTTKPASTPIRRIRKKGKK